MTTQTQAILELFDVNKQPAGSKRRIAREFALLAGKMANHPRGGRHVSLMHTSLYRLLDARDAAMRALCD